MRAPLALLLWISLAGSACAGAWLREEGQAFLSTSQEAWGDGGYTAFYGEYGLGRGLTVGLDAGQARGAAWGGVLYARGALGPAEGAGRMAWELGAGHRSGDGAVIRPGLMLGRGFDWGWAGLDTFAEYRSRPGDIAYKADATLGLSRRDGTRLYILQLQGGKYPGSDAYLRLAPAHVRRWGKAKVEIGLSLGLIGDDRRGLKLGTWWTF